MQKNIYRNKNKKTDYEKKIKMMLPPGTKPKVLESGVGAGQLLRLLPSAIKVAPKIAKAVPNIAKGSAKAAKSVLKTSKSVLDRFKNFRQSYRSKIEKAKPQWYKKAESSKPGKIVKKGIGAAWTADTAYTIGEEAGKLIKKKKKR